MYLRYEGGYKAYEGTSKWKKADYVRNVADLILENIAVEEERAKILCETVANQVAEVKESIMTAQDSVEVMKILEGYPITVLEAVMCEIGTDFTKKYMQDGLERLPEESVRFWLELGITECLEGEKIFKVEKLSA